QDAEHCGQRKKQGERQPCKSGSESHRPYSNEKGAQEKLTAAPTPKGRRANGPSEGVEDCSSAYFVGCFGRLQVRRIYFSLPSREFRIAFAIPHSTNPGNNWYSLMTGIMVQGTTTSRFLLRYAR